MAYIFWAFIALILVSMIRIIVRQRKFEKGLSEETRKSRKLLRGASVYTDRTNNQTFVCYHGANKTFTLLDFQTQEIVKAGKGRILLDHNSRTFYVCSENEAPPTYPTKISFGTIVDIQILQKGKSKTKTEGGISPISIAGYRIISVTKRKLYQVEHILLRITYNDLEGQKYCDVTVFRGLIDTKEGKYERLIDTAIEVKNRLEQLQ